MAYKSLRAAAEDLERNGKLVRIKEEVDPYLEMAEIHKRVFDAKGPALLFENVKGSPFQAISNLYGTFERTEFLFRHSIAKVKKVIALKADPTRFLKSPSKYISAPFTALKGLPMKSSFSVPATYAKTTIDQLPQVVSWKDDGGAFITLPQVFTLPPHSKNMMESNLGMYRIQLSGNEYIPNEEIGLHYQIHRGIGVHHTAYNKIDQPFKASIFVGGLPSHAFSAIMPLPEGLSELTFAGMLASRRFRYSIKDGHVISNDADFVIVGTIMKDVKKPEGPFGDHLGYYSLQHDFPVMKVEAVYHRKDPLWHFTVVGRPPQEDSSFGYLIHQLVEELAGQEFPGLKEINAVDAAGVHPLLLAIGSERYMPFRDKKPEEILTIANRILGSGQTSLAKYLWIAADSDGPVNAHDIPAFFDHVLARVDWKRDLHFQTNTTIDTLDYSGDGWNAGSKLVVACCGDPIRTLSANLPSDFKLPDAFKNPKFFQKGILVIEAPKFSNYNTAKNEMEELSAQLSQFNMEEIPLVIIADSSTFSSATLNNFVWTTFTRSNPSHDIYGVNAFTKFKHWGCLGSLIIDARIKGHHAPPLLPDQKTSLRVDELFAKNGSLSGIL